MTNERFMEYNKQLSDLDFARREASRIRDKEEREVAQEIADKAYYKKHAEFNDERGETPEAPSVQVTPVDPRQLGWEYATDREITSLTYKRAQKRMDKEIELRMSGR